MGVHDTEASAGLLPLRQEPSGQALPGGIRYVFRLEIDADCGIPAMVGAVQTFGDLIHWHPHIHAIVPEGVFTENGHFVHIPDIWKHRVTEFWQERVFGLLLDQHKITEEIAGSMKSWRHSGFSVDNSVRIEAGDA